MCNTLTLKSDYFENVDPTVGVAIYGAPAIVYDITIVSDSGATGVIALFDGTSVAGTKKAELRIPASTTQHIYFPKGKKFSTGIFAKANVAALDLAIDYD